MSQVAFPKFDRKESSYERRINRISYLFDFFSGELAISKNDRIERETVEKIVSFSLKLPLSLRDFDPYGLLCLHEDYTPSRLKKIFLRPNNAENVSDFDFKMNLLTMSGYSTWSRNGGEFYYPREVLFLLVFVLDQYLVASPIVADSNRNQKYRSLRISTFISELFKVKYRESIKIAPETIRHHLKKMPDFYDVPNRFGQLCSELNFISQLKILPEDEIPTDYRSYN